ncbi:MAG: ABC transporter ATP-binding protein/permease [Defluviitaleaceae bacterium]|nr:ABC transporter ATP-binding protein/permease [Defluviitaleaceae bacterium]
MSGRKLGYFGAIKFLSKYMAQYKGNFIRFYIGFFFSMILTVVMPILFGVMIDEIVYHQNIESFLRISLVFVIMSVFSCILFFLIYAQHQYLMTMYCLSIQRDVFRHLQKSSPEHLSDAKSGDIITLIQQYCRECMYFVIRNIIHLANGILEMVIITVFLFIISPQIGLLVLIAAPVSVFVSARFGKKIREYSNEQREIYGVYVSFVYEVFTAIRDIRLLGARQKVGRDVVGWHRQMFRVGNKSKVSTIAAQNIISFTNLALQLSIFTLAAWLVGRNEITIGLLTVVLAYFASLTRLVERLSGSYLDAQNRVGFIQRIYDFLHMPTEDYWQGKNELVITNGEIEFRDVNFAYKDGRDVLRGFNLHINAGERFAMCGKSGCGKTTLAYMLIGFYKAGAGEIFIDGQSLMDCSLLSIRKNIGMVSQDVLLFDGSIKDNVLLGKPKASDEEVCKVLMQAGIWEYVKALPNGIDTIIGTGGTMLSGGQKQRIAIARIYLKDPKIIIFDEATSALDDETEANIHDAWEAVLAGRTSIIIAHRQSSVMLCGRAAIVEGGRVVELGNPQDMAKNNSRFKELFAVKEVGQCSQN